MGLNKMEQIIVLKEPKRKVTDAVTLFKRIKKVSIDYNQENFIIFYLRTDNTIINSEILFKGGLNACLVDPKTLFRRALLKNANALILAHNHPSGSLKPSEEDKLTYEKLKSCGKMMSLKVLDFIVFNKNSFYSLKAFVL